MLPVLQEVRKACKLIQARFEITEVRGEILKIRVIKNTQEINLIIQVDDWMATVDTNKDGSLSYEEFKQSLEGKMSIIG